jgi:hypothetical protein
MGKKVDIDLIVAFIEGSLSNEKKKYVRERIDNDNEWFLEYMNLKEGEYQYKTYLGENTDTEEFSSNLLPNKNETIFAAFSALSPFYSAVLIGFVSVGAVSILFMDTIIKGFKSSFKGLGNEIVQERGIVENGDFTTIDFSSKNDIVITNNALVDLFVSIYQPSNISINKIPEDAYFRKILSSSQLVISHKDIYEFFELDFSNKVPLKILIYDSKEKIYQEMVIE